MNNITLGIGIGFLLLGTLILWFIIGTKGRWWLKALTIALTLFFSVFLLNSTEELTGWPSAKNLPNKFYLHWIVIEEPFDKKEGGIYIWANELTDYNIIINGKPQKETKIEPRAYRLPYTKETHEQMAKILAQIKKGKQFIGDKGGFEEGDGGNGKGKKGFKFGKSKKDGKGGWSFSQEQEFIIHELPPPKYPPKLD